MSWDLGTYDDNPIRPGGRFGRVEFVDSRGSPVAGTELVWDGELELARAKVGPFPHTCEIAGADLVRADGRHTIPFAEAVSLPRRLEVGQTFEIRCNVTGWRPLAD